MCYIDYAIEIPPFLFASVIFPQQSWGSYIKQHDSIKMEYNDPVEYEKKDPGQVGLHNVELARSDSDDLKDTKEHLFDGNYDPAAVIRTPSMMDDEIEEDSPYPEVRAAVSNMDDHTMHVNTWRVWFLGMFWTIIMAGVNQVSTRWPRAGC